jgi:trans-2,3-dihydro-3-hydroxyanthranilate isomerase
MARLLAAIRCRSCPMPLTALLVAACKIAEDTIAIVEEGYALGWPGRSQVTVSGQRVRVGGSGLVVADGILNM